MAVELLQERLPPPWNYAVTYDGRVFFINEESRSTTWLHPVYNQPVQSGHYFSQELPVGWEESMTPEGAPYYIDHTNLRTTFHHPITGEASAINITPEGSLQAPQSPGRESIRSQTPKKKQKPIPGTPPAKRIANAPVTFKGWLHIQDHGTLKSWRRRWCVLADYILYYYKSLDESQSRGSMVLPSYKISLCAREDKINRKFAFKAEHENMRTEYFSAEMYDEMRQWMSAMGLASIMQKDPSQELEYNNNFLKPSDHDNMQYWRAPTSDQLQPPEQAYRDSFHRDYPHWSDEEDGRVRDSYNSQDIPQQDTPSSGDLKRWGAMNLQNNPEKTWYESESNDGSLLPPDSDFKSGSLASTEPSFNQQQPWKGGYPGDQNPYHQPSRDSTLTRDPPSQHSTLTRQDTPDRYRYDTDKVEVHDNATPQSYRPSSQLTDNRNSGTWGSQYSEPRNRDQQDSSYGHYSPRRAEQLQQTPDQRSSFASSRPGSHMEREWYQTESLTVEVEQTQPAYFTPPHAQLGQLPQHSQSQPALNQERYPTDQSPPASHRDRYPAAYSQPNLDSDRYRSSTRSLNTAPSDIAPQDRNEWQKPRDRSSGSLHSPRLPEKPAPKSPQPSSQQPIYENLSSAAGSDLSPELSPGSPKPRRPPLPASYRQQIAKELAETKTPNTRQEMLTAVDMERKRQDDPYYFQYPEGAQRGDSLRSEPLQQREGNYSREQPVHREVGYRTEQPVHSDGGYRAELPVHGDGGFRAEQPVHSDGGYRAELPVHGDGGYRAEQPVHNDGGYRAELPERRDGRYRSEEPEHRDGGYRRQQSDERTDSYRSQPDQAETSNRRPEFLDKSYGSMRSDTSRNNPLQAYPQGTSDPKRHSGVSQHTESEYSLPTKYQSGRIKVMSPAAPSVEQSKEVSRRLHGNRTAHNRLPYTRDGGSIFSQVPPSNTHSRKQHHQHKNDAQSHHVPHLKQKVYTVRGIREPREQEFYSGVKTNGSLLKTPQNMSVKNQSKQTQLSSAVRKHHVSFEEPSSHVLLRDHGKRKAIRQRRRKSRSLTLPSSSSGLEDDGFVFNNLDIDLEVPWARPGVLRPWSVASPFVDEKALEWGASPRCSMRAMSHSVEVLTGSPRHAIVLGIGARMIKHGRQQAPHFKSHGKGTLDQNGYRDPSPYSQHPAPSNTLYPQTQLQTNTMPPRSPTLGQGHRNMGQGQGSRSIHPIKEDPNMPDTDVLNMDKMLRLQNSLMGNRLRLSICAGDLVGKTHEELVLLLIQLRRSQSRLEGARDWYRKELDVTRDYEREYNRERESLGQAREELEEGHEHYIELKKQNSELEKRLDVHKPLVNLVDNLVTMGSLYGGNTALLLSEYKKHKLAPGEYSPPKKMIEFSRRHQEHRLHEEQEEGIRQLTEEEAHLEEKLEKLFELDRDLQEQSYTVTSLQEDRELLEKALEGIREQEAQENMTHLQPRLTQQRHTVEGELTKVRQQLADSFKALEERSAENAKIENEVILLRKKIARGLNRNPNSPGLNGDTTRDRQRLAEEVDNIQSLIDGLSQQGAQLSSFMSGLRPPPTQQAADPLKPSTYAETDLDSMVTRDLATHSPMTIYKKSSLPPATRLTGPHPSYSTSDIPQQMAMSRDRPSSAQGLTRSGSMGLYPNKQPAGPYYENLHRRERSLDDDQLNTHPDGSYTPLDINDADENTKRFFGILPRGPQKAVTVRDVKKRESERKDRRRGPGDYSFDSDMMQGPLRRTRSLPRKLPEQSRNSDGSFQQNLMRPQSSRDIFRKKLQGKSGDSSEKRRSASERLFPTGHQPSPVVVPPLSKERVRRLSDLVSPRPFPNSAQREANGLQGMRPVSMSSGSRASYGSESLDSRGPDDYRSQPSYHPVSYNAKGPGQAPQQYNKGPNHSYEHPTSAPYTRAQPSVATVRPVVKPDLVYPAQATPISSSQPWNRKSDTTPTSIATVKPMSANDSAASWQSNATSTWGTPQSSTRETPQGHSREASLSSTRETPQTSTWESPQSVAKNRSHIRDRHRTPKGRFMTVSSSEPIRLETSPARRKKYNTSAGDLITSQLHHNLPDLVKGDNRELYIDDDTIDREVLFMPDKVDIPERYIPDSDDEEMTLTTAEQRIRAEKAEKIRKMLAVHSLQEWTESEVDMHRSGNIHASVKEEKQRREHVLDIRQALAKEVKQKSREVAERSMRDFDTSDSHRRSELRMGPLTPEEDNRPLVAPPLINVEN